MALALTPRLLRRGLELFAVISLAGVIVVLAVYGENVQAVARALLHLHWGWMVVGLGLASMDWFGGGTRLWVVARHVHPRVRLEDMIIAGGMSACGAYHDVGHAPVRRAPSRSDDVHVHDVRGHRSVLRRRGTARHLPRRREVSRATQRGPGDHLL